MERFNAGNHPSKHRLANARQFRKSDRVSATGCTLPGPFLKEDFAAKYISDLAKSLITDAAAHRVDVSEFQLDSIVLKRN